MLVITWEVWSLKNTSCSQVKPFTFRYFQKFELENNSYLFQYGPTIGTTEFRQSLADFLSTGYQSKVNKYVSLHTFNFPTCLIWATYFQIWSSANIGSNAWFTSYSIDIDRYGRHHLCRRSHLHDSSGSFSPVWLNESGSRFAIKCMLIRMFLFIVYFYSYIRFSAP